MLFARLLAAALHDLHVAHRLGRPMPQMLPGTWRKEAALKGRLPNASAFNTARMQKGPQPHVRFVAVVVVDPFHAPVFQHRSGDGAVELDRRDGGGIGEERRVLVVQPVLLGVGGFPLLQAAASVQVQGLLDLRVVVSRLSDERLQLLARHLVTPDQVAVIHSRRTGTRDMSYGETRSNLGTTRVSTTGVQSCPHV